MRAWAQQLGWIARTTVRGFVRDGRMVLMLIVAMASASAGWWWRDFNFGPEEGRFLMNFGISVQAVGSLLLAVAGVLSVVWRERLDGTDSVLQARGISAGAIVGGRLTGVWWLNLVFVVGSTGVIAVTLSQGGHAVPGSVLVWVAALHLAKAAVVAAFTLWFAGYGRNIVFVVLATGLMTTLGHLKALANEIAGWGWWLSRPVPDLGRLGAGDWMMDGMALSARLGTLGYASGYVLIFGWLASRAYSRREY